MVDFSFFFLSMSSISAVLLGICVSLRNNSFSGLLHPNIGEVEVKGKQYKDVLKRSGKYSTFAGGFFVGSTVLGTIGFLLSNSYLANSDVDLWNITLLDSGLFTMGILFMGWALVFDYVSLGWPVSLELDWPPLEFNPPEKHTEERPETELMDATDDQSDN